MSSLSGKNQKKSLLLPLVGIFVGLCVYPFGPRIVALVWHMFRDHVEYAGLRVPIPARWFAIQGDDRTKIVRFEPVLARKLWEGAEIDLNPMPVREGLTPQELYIRWSEKIREDGPEQLRTGVRTFVSVPVAGQNGLCVQKSISGDFTDSEVVCMVEGKMTVDFVGNHHYIPDFYDLLKSIH